MALQKKVPPDGGWGWMIVVGTALSNFCILPIMFSFGLIFRDLFDDYGLSHKDASFILNLNNALSMLTGMINGALLKYWGCRKVGVLAGFLISFGIVLTSSASTFWQFVLYYGSIAAFGMGMSRSAFNLAINMYFDKNRGKAISVAMTVTGIGPILMPQLISYMMTHSTPQNAILIIGAISANTLVAAVLLQPIKWHMKTIVVDNEEEESLICNGKMVAIPEEGSDDESPKKNFKAFADETATKERPPLKRGRSYIDSVLPEDKNMDAGAFYGFDTPLARSLLSLNEMSETKSSSNKTKIKKSASASVIYNRIQKTKSSPILQRAQPAKIVKFEMDEPSQSNEESLCKRIMKGLVNIFDLKLLCDPTYVNIMVGMSLAIFAEMNFTILMPFIFSEIGLTVTQNATCLSTLSIADLIFRFLTPCIESFTKQSPRMMYLVTLGILIVIRSALLFAETYTHLLCVSVAIGMTKGVRIIYRNLLIPSVVPVERLASANGMQMVLNGVFILIGGTILGVIRDQTGNYYMCIIAINLVTFTCILMWCIEMVYVKFKRKRTDVNV